MKTLSARQIILARSIASALFDDGAAGVPEDRLAHVARELRAHFLRMGHQTRLAFRASLWMVQLSPILWRVRLRRFVGLSLPDRIRFLTWLETSRFGLVLVLLKTVFGTLYFEHPDALAHSSYDGQGLLGPAVINPSAASPRTMPLPVLSSDGARVAEGG